MSLPGAPASHHADAQRLSRKSVYFSATLEKVCDKKNKNFVFVDKLSNIYIYEYFFINRYFIAFIQEHFTKISIYMTQIQTAND